MKPELADLIEIVSSFGIPLQWHSWIQVPRNELPEGEHRFASYFIPQMRFGGDDLRTQYYDYTVRISFFYFDYFDSTDMMFEEAFEEACRGYVDFVKNSGYIDGHNVYFSEYTFDFKKIYLE